MAYVDVSRLIGETPADAFARRRAELFEGWKFACTCSRCEEDKKTLGLEDSLPVKDGSKLDFDRVLNAQKVP